MRPLARTPLFKTNEVLLKNLISDVETGKIQLPDFQRGWVWDDDHIKSLLASISKRFPMGAVMTLEAGGEIKFQVRPIEGVENPTSEPTSFLLDGQQRLTSIYQALRRDKPVVTRDNRNRLVELRYYIDMKKALDPSVEREEAIISVSKDRKTWNFRREVVLDLSTPDLEYRHHLMPTEKLLDPMQWMLGYIRHWNSASAVEQDCKPEDFFQEFSEIVLAHFNEYHVPVISLEKETPKEAVCVVFEKVNTQGVSLTVFELATAAFAADNFSLRDDWLGTKGQPGRMSRLHGYPGGVLQSIGGDGFLQAVALLKTQGDRRAFEANEGSSGQPPAIGCRRRDILNLTAADYQQWADNLEEGFKKAADFLRSQFVFGPSNVPYATQLIALAALFVELGRELEPHNAKAKLEQWYWAGVFGEVYGGAVETRFALDLVEVAQYVRGGPRPAMVDQATFSPARLVSLKTRRSAAYKGLYALQMKRGAADWRTGDDLSFITYQEKRIDIHHIFPKNWCARSTPRIPASLYDSVINKTPIAADTNRRIGGNAPSVYLGRLRGDIESSVLDKVLAAHWLEPEHLQQDDFAASFIARGEAMMSLVGQAMGKNLGSGREIFSDYLRSNGLDVPVDESLGSAAEIEEFDDEPEEFGEFGDTE